MGVPPLSGLTNPLFAVVGYGVGTATGPVLRPFVQDLANFAWSEHRIRPFSADTAAQMWVEGVWTEDRAKTEASYTGISDSRMDALHDLIDNPPDVATLFALWRRGLIGEARFREGLRHLRIEQPYFDALTSLHNVLLTPGELAQARQRGFVTQARQYDESELQGVTNDRAEIMFKSAGLPPPTERALTMWRRGIITEAEFKQTVVEGNEKLKYQDEEAALFHPLLTPATIVNQRLRGWRDTAWMDARLAEHGYTPEQANDLFEGQGRPISFRQVFIGGRRGGVYNGGTGAIDPPFLKSLQESNIRPEWYNLAWAQRHSLPSVFVMRALTQDGTWSRDKAEQRLLMSGWIAEDAAEAADKWSGQAAGVTTVGPRVKAAQTTAITEIRNAYLIGQADETQARDWLNRIGVEPDEIDGMIPVWNVMREVPQKGLTAAQIKKAAKSLPAQWPRARALDELQLLGLTADDAATLLDE
jgi:hypothetical protein